MKRQIHIIVFSASVRAVLAAVKLAVAWLSGSIAVAADGMHTLCDVFVTVAILVCLLITQIKSRRFPHGLNKAEDLVSLLVSFAIFYVGYEIVRDAALSAGSSTLTHPVVALVAALFSAAVMWALARYERRVGLATGSPGVKADAEHNRVDVFASLVVALGVFGEIAGVHLEWLAAILVAVLVFAAGAKILIDAITVLLEGNLDAETLKVARRIVLTQPGVASLRAIDGRNSGSTKILQMVLGVEATELSTAHDICDGLERRLHAQIPNLHRVLIHYEPEDKRSQAEPSRHERTNDARHEALTA